MATTKSSATSARSMTAGRRRSYEEGKARIQLDVADSNHRARELYKRQGYVVVKTIRFGFMRRFMGYGGVDTMDRVLDQAAAEDGA